MNSTKTTGTILQDDDNFRLEKIDWQGRLAIKKSAKETTPPSRAARIKNDVDGMRFFARLAVNNPELGIYIPKVYASGPNFYIREYIESDPLLKKTTTFDEARGRLDKLSQLLADIDRIEPGREIGYVGSSNHRNLGQSISRWADENIHDKLMTKDQAEHVKSISKGLGKYLQPRIAHGDMSAYKHSYLRPNGEIALIDFENFTSGAAQYFDVAWAYTRLYGFATSVDMPKYFLSSFIGKAAPTEHQPEKLMAVLIQRTLGMQKDADGDAKKGTDYRNRAAQLLEIVLQNKLELLHS